MKIKSLLVSGLALGFSAGAHSDAFKCKTPDARIVISNVPCQAGSRTEAVQPTDEVSPEQVRRAEQERERERKLLVEREAARTAEQQREQESRRKLAEEESLRQSQCLQAAQREPDPQLRANLIATCTGAPPPQPAVVQSPVYYPVAPVPGTRHRRNPEPRCISGDCTQPPGVQPKQPATELPKGSRSLCTQNGKVVPCN